MTVDLMDMFQRHGYDDAFLFGHALEGNLHLVFSQVGGHPVGPGKGRRALPAATQGFRASALRRKRSAGTPRSLPHCLPNRAILLQGFRTPEEVQRFHAMFDELCHIVATKHSGSLKGEHGTGRNVAPYVEMEWGEWVEARGLAC